jgi:hypothetical protein
MKQFIQTKFFLLINGTSIADIHPSVLDNAYEEFAEVVFAKTAGASDRVVLHQSLCYIKAEFMSLQRQLTNKFGKKVSP